MKSKLFKIFLVIIVVELLQLFQVTYAQVLNVDRASQENDTIDKAFNAVFDVSLEFDKQKEDLFMINNQTEFSLKMKNELIFLFLNSNELFIAGKQVIENDGYFQLRFRDDDKRRLFPDTYVQYQWNSVVGLRSRALVGSNLRYKLVEADSIDLYSSVGVFYEDEFWDPSISSIDFSNDLIKVRRQIIRLNTVIKFATIIGDKADLAVINYVQFPLNEFFLQPRWFMDLNLNIHMSRRWSFLIHYFNTVDYYRPLPIASFYYGLDLGFRLNL